MVYKFLSSLIIIFVLLLIGCSQTHNPSLSSEKDFLKKYEFDVEEEPVIIRVEVPANWQTRLGEYPLGLYWGLVNEYSKDVGLDLTSLKGKSVEVHIYELVDGLPGRGEQANFKCPANVFLIVDDKQVIGAWLDFDTRNIGFSVKKRTLDELTGLGFEEWLSRNHYFETSGTNEDLQSLTPKQVIDTFFDSINKGDMLRAYACLSPQSLLESLIMNLEPGHLYNEGFSQSNSLVDNIVKGTPIEYLQIYDPDNHLVEIKDVGKMKKVGIAVNLEIEWKHPAFNTSDMKSTRFAILQKYDNGWKLYELGTGP